MKLDDKTLLYAKYNETFLKIRTYVREKERIQRLKLNPSESLDEELKRYQMKLEVINGELTSMESSAFNELSKNTPSLTTISLQ